MRDARQLTLSAMGVVMALAAFEHGLGEVLQGPVAPASVFIQSWPDSEFYRSLSGEPAMTLIPSLSISGLATMALSILLLYWAVWLVGKRYSAAIVALLSMALLLVGGGFGPPVLGLILVAAATKVRSPLSWWCARCPSFVRDKFALAWPVLAVICVAVWLTMLFGVAALDYFLGFENEVFTWSLLAVAFIVLPLTLMASMARDAVKLIAGHS